MSLAVTMTLACGSCGGCGAASARGATRGLSLVGRIAVSGRLVVRVWLWLLPRLLALHCLRAELLLLLLLLLLRKSC
jgi:hypothetical protein